MNEIKWHPAGNEPLYNIRAVSQITDISVETLRAWERRYGFPRPTRTAGNHRLYSEEDVRRLRWVKTQIEQGIQTSQAVRALHQMNPIQQHSDFEARGVQDADLRAIPLATQGVQLAELLLRHELEGAERLLSDLMATYSVEELLLEVFPPAFAGVGQAWLDGRCSVATEHLASYFLRQRILTWIIAAPPARGDPQVILAGAPGELHEGSLLILHALLRRRGWSVIYLGPSMPLEDVAKMASESGAPIIVFVAMTEEPARALLQWPRFFPHAARAGRPVIGFGGRIFTEDPTWRKQTPGWFLGASLREGFATLETILAGLS